MLLEFYKINVKETNVTVYKHLFFKAAKTGLKSELSDINLISKFLTLKLLYLGRILDASLIIFHMALM